MNTTERRNYRSNTLQAIAMSAISAIAASGDGLVGIVSIALIVLVVAVVEVVSPRYRMDRAENTHTRTHTLSL
ncbi:MAG: hypothetical protein KatS3mg100_737 [Candidatus Parcubacteria bacterium]|nr:MAG: hypothetical protein KatS3mg100_737 [Candidatus Parcubacteria bacterium]